MIFPLEDRWGGLSLLEHEYGARETLLSLNRAGELSFAEIPEPQREDFIRNTAAPYAAQSFHQAKEFFRHAESSSWLVKPLLLYYGMLAATKASLTFTDCDFFLTAPSRKHGLSRDKTTGQSSLTDARLTIQVNGVFPSARARLHRSATPADLKVRVDEILCRLPDTFGSYRLYTKGSETQFIQTEPAWVARSPLVSSPAHIVFDLPEAAVEAKRSLLPPCLATDFEVVRPHAGALRFVSHQTWAEERDANLELQRGFVSALAPTLDNKAAFILPIEIDGTLHQFTEIELIYLITFYFSEIARYSPHIWLQMHSGAENFSVLLCQDVLRACENKFLQSLQNKMVYAVLTPFAQAMSRPPAPDVQRLAAAEGASSEG
jgi:YaaC-like Protein